MLTTFVPTGNTKLLIEVISAKGRKVDEKGGLIQTTGLTKVYGRVRRARIVELGGAIPARSTGCSGRTGRERRRRFGSSSACSGRRQAARGGGVRLLAAEPRRPPAGRLSSGRAADVRVDDRLSARLRMLSDLRDGVGLDRAVAIAERVMKLDLGRKLRTYSTGMKQKLALAQVFADPVQILILDEPTSALDPSARSIVLALVQEARSHGQTVIFSGHVLAEVEQVADRVAIMRQGRLMHVEDMHARRGLRMLLLRFDEGTEPDFPG